MRAKNRAHLKGFAPPGRARFIQAIDPIDLEFLGTNDVMILFKYINISNSYYAEDSLYLKHPQN